MSDKQDVEVARPAKPTMSRMFGASKKPPPQLSASSNASLSEKEQPPSERWSMGILNDKKTEEVPGTVLLLSAHRNEPLGIQHQQGHQSRTSVSSLPSPYPQPSRSITVEKKRTPDGQIVLEPQPDDSLNDPLNWSALRRDSALISLGFYCMLGGGMTPILAAGFNNVATTFDVTFSRVALTTGLYMMGLGVGSIIASPTAIIFGKRPVYLVSAIMFALSSIWCGQATSYASLATARVFQGISVSPVECLPSASIAEIFFLHERAFRIGIYTLLLLGGKNLVPLVSAVIIQAKGWRWVFYIVAIIVGFGAVLLFLFVPETFWDRTPRPKLRRPSVARRSVSDLLHHKLHSEQPQQLPPAEGGTPVARVMTARQQYLHAHNTHARFEAASMDGAGEKTKAKPGLKLDMPDRSSTFMAPMVPPANRPFDDAVAPELHNLNSPYYADLENNDDYLSHHMQVTAGTPPIQTEAGKTDRVHGSSMSEKDHVSSPAQSPNASGPEFPGVLRYTTHLRQAPPKSYVQSLKVWNGRLVKSNWFLVALRPFILFIYPAVLWSTLVYSLSVGWLIVLSESVSHVYQNKETYNFSALGTGLVYLSPFIGGVLGTAVAGKVSDIIVRFMARRNGGVYEPEFRLVMALPVAISTAIGLMGFGWSAEERDRWIVPTIFFGIISFGCSLGSTTAITFCVDSYRQYAGEALVTLNVGKNIFHGLVFSLFFPAWLEHDGSKNVFLAIGGIQIACLLTTIPMYIYGKRARMWTVRKSFMEKF